MRKKKQMRAPQIFFCLIPEREKVETSEKIFLLPLKCAFFFGDDPHHTKKKHKRTDSVTFTKCVSLYEVFEKVKDPFF